MPLIFDTINQKLLIALTKPLAVANGHLRAAENRTIKQ